MEFGFTTAAYVVAAILFILSLGGLSGQESAKRAVWYGMAGMALAVVATLIGPGAGLWLLSLILIGAGGAIGYQVAQRVQMTEMPQLVAAMHSLVGLAAVFVGFNAHLEMGNVLAMDDAAKKAAEGFAALLAKKGRRRDRYPAGRGLLGCVHRCGDLHRINHRLWQTGGQSRHHSQKAARWAYPERRGCCAVGSLPDLVF